jgi:hypothetical protein
MIALSSPAYASSIIRSKPDRLSWLPDTSS